MLSNNPPVLNNNRLQRLITAFQKTFDVVNMAREEMLVDDARQGEKQYFAKVSNQHDLRPNPASANFPDFTLTPN